MSLSRDRLNYLAAEILDASMCVHKELGPGLLESVYHCCLVKELSNRKFNVEMQVPIQLHYKGVALQKEFIIDMLVEDEIVLELKAIEVILPVHKAQLISYLKISNKRLGFLINFNVPLIKQGFMRFVNNF